MIHPLPAHASGTFAIGGELSVHRLGFGAMRLPGVRGEPRPSQARDLLREAVRLGVDLIDTAHAYGRSEELIADALHPYPDEGKIRLVGLSEVSVDELRRARRLLTIATVQNRFNLAERSAGDVLAECEAHGLGFLHWAPIAMGGLLGASSALAGVAARNGVTQAQVALAWMLHRSPVMLPIPGTGSLEHLRENVGAAGIERPEDDLAGLER